MLPISNLILSAPPANVQAAQAYGRPVAHMAYRIGAGPHLFRVDTTAALRGGYMVVDSVGFGGAGDHIPFCHEVMRECAGRGFRGVFLDFEGPVTPLLEKIAGELSALTHTRNLALFLPEAYARFSDRANVLISSALSGGSLTQRLGDAVSRFGAGRVALAVERVCEDFFLPSPSGQGTPLTREELRARMEQRKPSVFFSNELCAHYFTYMSPQSGAHFILFDDAGSILKKLDIARSLGIDTAVLAYPELDDLLPRLLG